MCQYYLKILNNTVLKLKKINMVKNKKIITQKSLTLYG